MYGYRNIIMDTPTYYPIPKTSSQANLWRTNNRHKEEEEGNEKLPEMNKVCSPYFDPDFHNLPERIYGPTCRVCIENETFGDCTVIKVDSVNKQGLLLEVVQILTDLDLTISKSYISSDAGWFMDVFHVKDEHGSKLQDQRVINYIEQAIGTTREATSPGSTISYNNETKPDPESEQEHTAIEMTGSDRPGLFSEISATLADLHCNIVEAHAWSHNARLACVAYISDQATDTPIEDPDRLASIEGHLATVLRVTTAGSHTTSTDQVIKTSLHGVEGTLTPMTSSVERRLHQLMLSVRDFEGPPDTSETSLSSSSSAGSLPDGGDQKEGGGRRSALVMIENCHERGYSIVSIECKDRRRLMFDTVCTLTDMQYIIFHASIDSHDGSAFQEYFIRHIDGCPLNTQSEKERVIKCLEAAIERRVCEGVKLKLRAHDRVGLLSDITRVLRENGLAVVRADVATQGERAVYDFYVRGIFGNEVDMELVESMKKEIVGPIDLEVKNDRWAQPSPRERTPSGRYSFGDMLRSQIERFSHNFVTIK